MIEEKSKLDQIYDLVQKNGVKLEQLASDIKAVAEGHAIIRREAQEMKGELVSETNFIKSAVKFVSDKVNKIDRDLGEIKESVDKIDRTLDEHVKLPAHAK